MAPMARTLRVALGGYCYHVLNRGNGRRTVFHKDADFHAFVKLLRDADDHVPRRRKGVRLGFVGQPGPAPVQRPGPADGRISGARRPGQPGDDAEGELYLQ